VTDQLRNFVRSLSLIAEYDTELQEIHDKAEGLSDDLEEVVSLLEGFINGLDEESIEQLYTAQEKQIAIKSLVKKYGNSLNEVIEQRDAADAELEELESYNQPIEELEEELAEIFKEVISSAQEVTLLREKAALKMEKAVNKELRGLSMSGSMLKIQITKVKPSSTGQDEVELMLLAKGSNTPNPIAKSASGGELSRIMLALEVVLADPKNTGTFIFDEVDSGVGGETAIEIGKRLALLAKEAQVIVVTHLPQVAAYGDNHLKVLKTVTDDCTETNVQQLSEKARVAEITRMLSGMSDSETGKAHAAELIAHAKDFKNN
jgi:DNA repair protein RecN (Recombination protein N)